MKLSVIITAGGSSQRFGKDKLLEKIKGKEVILHSIEAFLPLMPQEIIVSASEKLEKIISPQLAHIKNLKIVRGGNTRQASVFNALKVCSEPDFVCIHDAARPLVKQENIKTCLEKALEKGAAITAVRATDTIKNFVSKSEALPKFVKTVVKLVPSNLQPIKYRFNNEKYLKQMLHMKKI